MAKTQLCWLHYLFSTVLLKYCVQEKATTWQEILIGHTHHNDVKYFHPQ